MGPVFVCGLRAHPDYGRSWVEQQLLVACSCEAVARLCPPTNKSPHLGVELPLVQPS
jgi:hypothetical protein